MGHPSVAHLVCLKETMSGRGRGHQCDLKALGRRDLNSELLRQDPGLRAHPCRTCLYEFVGAEGVMGWIGLTPGLHSSCLHPGVGCAGFASPVCLCI